MTTTSHVDVGDPLPELTLRDDAGQEVALAQLRGRRVVLYFYPRDDTPGCTTQACALRDAWGMFEAAGDVVVYGVSPDDAHSHERFRGRYQLPFHLLVDEDHRLADAFGFWVRKQRFGRTYDGIERSTVVVGSDGRVDAIARGVTPGDHVDWLAEQLGLASGS